MYDRLRMNDDRNLVGVKAEEPPRLDNFETLVHQGRRIDRYFVAHRPIWMGQRLLDGRALDRIFRPGTKRPAGRRQDQSLYL